MPEVTAPDGAVTRAVYHRSEQVVDELTPLQAATMRFQFLQARALWAVATNVAGLLWELSSEDGSQRLVSALIDRVPVASFSLTKQSGLPELRTSGSRLTASIGVATLPDVSDSAEGLLQAADASMYRVKSSGRNGIYIAGSENDPARVPTEEQELR